MSKIAPGALLAIFAVGLAGCVAEPRYPITGAPPGGGLEPARPRYDIVPGQTPAAPPPAAPPPIAAPPPDDDAPKASPSHAVVTTALPPAASAGRSDTLPPPPPPPPHTPGVSLSEWSSPAEPLPEGVKEVQVQPFETLYDVAERVRAPMRALIAMNDLKPPYALAVGTVLRVPAPVVYTVADGDTLFGVARRYSVDPRSLASLNGLDLVDRLKPGEILSLPPGVSDHGSTLAARGPRPVALPSPPPFDARVTEASRDLRPPPGSARTAADPSLGRPNSPSPAESEVFALGRGRFTWPVRGEILSTYGPKGPGQRNDGLNIAAEAGASVRASAAGVVVYAGNSIPAFGNLVLIKHPGGWATLYGNLGKITVANNAEVAQGQEVGSAGLSGAVDRPQVHFEIRYAADPRDKAKPLDPASVLPQG
jgi:murein DD-endopeptidase MepM/ murein hydrolase activator NlpD